jgi:hypothetical protein
MVQHLPYFLKFMFGEGDLYAEQYRNCLAKDFNSTAGAQLK